MKMAVHEHIGMHLNAVKCFIGGKEVKKFYPVLVISENFSFFHSRGRLRDTRHQGIECGEV